VLTYDIIQDTGQRTQTLLREPANIRLPRQEVVSQAVTHDPYFRCRGCHLRLVGKVELERRVDVVTYNAFKVRTLRHN